MAGPGNARADGVDVGYVAEDDLRGRLSAPAENPEQPLYVASGLNTGRVMVKDEDVCLHCGLCAERCPTGAWDMRKSLIQMVHAMDAPACPSRRGVPA